LCGRAPGSVSLLKATGNVQGIERHAECQRESHVQRKQHSNKIQEMTYLNPNGTIHYPRGLHDFSIINS